MNDGTMYPLPIQVEGLYILEAPLFSIVPDSDKSPPHPYIHWVQGCVKEALDLIPYVEVM